MQPVFGHGQLRLYLFAVLADGPRSGYDVIRGLEERFGGLYVPSAGTVYPRLAKLEEEGLVERTDEGRRSTYTLNDAGRAELAQRSGELAELEDSLDASAHRLADDMRRRVSSGTADLRSRLDEQARRARSDAEEVDDEVDVRFDEDDSGAGSPRSGASDAPFGQDWSSVAGWLGAASEQLKGAGGRFAEQGSRLADGPDPRSWIDAAANRWGDVDLSWLSPTERPRPPRPAPATGSTNLWADATDSADSAGLADSTTGAAGVSDDGARGGEGRRDNPWGWLGTDAMPDSSQLAAIGDIVRDAVERIQDVLRPDDPPQPTG